MLLAGIGGFIGTCCRYLVNRLYANLFNVSLPFATFTVNVIGCLFLGLIIGLMNRWGIVSPKISAFLIVGICGGFTTFSTFSYETFNLGLNGEAFISFLYILASIIFGLLAVWIGLNIAK